MTAKGFPLAVREGVAHRSGRICERCGLSEWVELHHRRARGMGSTKRPETNYITNSLGLCGDCHRFVESNRTHSLDMGWLVSQYLDPATIPVLYMRRWALLLPNGTIEYDNIGPGSIPSHPVDSAATDAPAPGGDSEPLLRT